MPVAIIVIVIVVLLLLWGLSLYNGIVRAGNRCDAAWQTIDAQLQRRNDLIPNLVETVKGYAAHESKVFTDVTSLRVAVANASTPEAKMEASDALTGAIRQLFAVAESYPDLKASTNFQQLQGDLADTENRISYARMSFNDVVLKYNNAVMTFPGSLIASIFGMKPRQGFEVASESVREAPKVNF